MRPSRARSEAPKDVTVKTSYRGRCRFRWRANRPVAGQTQQYGEPVHLPDAVAATLLARLPPDAGAVACRRGGHTVVGAAPDDVVADGGAGPLAALDALAPGFWVGWCTFELGHAVGRVAPGCATRQAPAVPDLCFARFDSVARIAPDGTVEIEGDGKGRGLLEAAAGARGDRPGDDAPCGAV